jgi:hypothetical protein
MLDVHAPDHEINGARDFFVHLFTITIGLLIALGLEAGVEAVHHRNQRKEAETLIRREIKNNHELLRDGTSEVKGDLQQMTRVLETLEARAQSQPGVLNEKDFIFREGPIQDAAWRTANSTGAVTYMDYAEVERFSDAYKEQALLQTLEEQAMDDYLELIPILAPHSSNGVVTPESAKDAIPYARRVVAHLSGMINVGVGTIGAYEDALK